jgi:hypothetical protein
VKSVLDIFLYKLQDPLAPLFSLIILFCFFLGTFLDRGELLLAKLLTFQWKLHPLEPC